MSGVIELRVKVDEKTKERLKEEKEKTLENLEVMMKRKIGKGGNFFKKSRKKRKWYVVDGVEAIDASFEDKGITIEVDESGTVVETRRESPVIHGRENTTEEDTKKSDEWIVAVVFVLIFVVPMALLVWFLITNA